MSIEDMFVAMGTNGDSQPKKPDMNARVAAADALVATTVNQPQNEQQTGLESMFVSGI